VPRLRDRQRSHDHPAERGPDHDLLSLTGRYARSAVRHTGCMADAEVFVGLTIEGSFDPDIVTSKLGLVPTHQARKGEFMSPRSARVATTSVWSIDSASTVDADTIEPHLEWMLDLIEPRAQALSALVAEDAFAYADCYWASVGRSGGPWVAPESMGRLAALNLPLVVSFYATDDVDEGSSSTDR